MIKSLLVQVLVIYYIAGIVLLYVVADIKPWHTDTWRWTYYFWQLSWEPFAVFCLIKHINNRILKVALWVLAGFMQIRLLWNLLELLDYRGILTNQVILHWVITILSCIIALLTFLPLVISGCTRALNTLKRKWQR